MTACSHSAAKRPHPLFALSSGDPAGIGQEITIKAFKHSEFADSVVVIGDAEILIAEAQKQGFKTKFNVITSVADFCRGTCNVFHCGILRPGMFNAGKAQSSCGNASYRYILQAINLALSGDVDGVITNPISKEALALAGIQYPGHTEIFADKTETTDFSMLFMLNNIGVAHVTTHCSLKSAINLINRDLVSRHIRLLHSMLEQMGIPSPRIAVGGLNPHAGENGLFGDEEILHIIPAIESAKRDGINAMGPFPPDTVFMRAFKGEFDGIVAMLHDHGFVALKSMDFEQGVNITIGLPIIRTSVGHGTAFDIAGRGIASEKSLCCAFEAARRLYLHRVGT